MNELDYRSGGNGWHIRRMHWRHLSWRAEGACLEAKGAKEEREICIDHQHLIKGRHTRYSFRKCCEGIGSREGICIGRIDIEHEINRLLSWQQQLHSNIEEHKNIIHEVIISL